MLVLPAPIDELAGKTVVLCRAAFSLRFTSDPLHARLHTSCQLLDRPPPSPPPGSCRTCASAAAHFLLHVGCVSSCLGSLGRVMARKHSKVAVSPFMLLSTSLPTPQKSQLSIKVKDGRRVVTGYTNSSCSAGSIKLTAVWHVFGSCR